LQAPDEADEGEKMKILTERMQSVSFLEIRDEVLLTGKR